jgi:hypothetical protein
MKTLYVAREDGTTEKQIAELIKDTIFETWPNDSMAIEKNGDGPNSEEHHHLYTTHRSSPYILIVPLSFFFLL